MKKMLHLTIKILLHILAVYGVIIAFWPMGVWYFSAKPLWGVDFFYTASLVNLLRHNFVLPNMNWGYAWFSGWPMLSNYPILHYYFIAPLTNFFSLIDAVKIWMLVSLALFFLGIYAVCFRLSKNYAVAFVLALAAIYSVGVYGTLMWGGSLPSHATQAFFPWTLFFVIGYLKTHKVKQLLIGALLAGLAILSHPQVVIAYIYPTVSLLLIFGFGHMKFIKRIISLSAFLIISFLVGLPLLYSSMGGALKTLIITHVNESMNSTARLPSKLADDIDKFHKAQPLRIFTDSNTFIFYLLAIALMLFVVSLISIHYKSRLARQIQYIIVAAFSAFYVWIFSYGISIYHGGWYRLFWAVPVWVGILAATFWGSYEEHIEQVLKKKFLHISIHSALSIIVLVVGIFSVYYFSKDIRSKIILRSNTSSAYPDILNLHASTSEFESLKSRMVPSWIDTANTQYRMFTADQTINIWWSSMYKMPLGRGYFDPPIPAINRGYFFLLDTSLSQEAGSGEDQLVGIFHYSPSIALNNTLFFTDWYDVKYIESGSTLAAFTPLPKSFNNSTYIKQDQKLDFNSEKYQTGDMSLHYYEVKDEYTSPIMEATNVPTLGIIASSVGYENVLRGIADMNYSSKKVIPLKLGQSIDSLSEDDLKAMDALIVYDYKYSNKNKAFKLLTDYVSHGKKLFIDTGVEVAEATAQNLPELFPVSNLVRKPQGAVWEFETVDADIVKGSDIAKFDPPLFDKDPWSISYPSDGQVRDGAKILLKNKGMPVLVSQKIGNGEVIWSGINVPYHTIRTHNADEVNFWKNVLSRIIPPDAVEKAEYSVNFIDPQHREIKVAKAKGVLFHEQLYDGWNAHISNTFLGSNSKIYPAGPAYPGFMYVRLPDDISNTTVTFSYGGSLMGWITTIISLLISISLLEEVLLGGRFFGKLRLFVWRKFHMRMKKWWSKDDEE